MDHTKFKYKPLPGGTYTFFGKGETTTEYYKLVNTALDELLQQYSDKEQLLDQIQQSTHKSFLQKLFKTDVDYGMLSGGVDYILNNSHRVRGFLGIGLDDGAADFTLFVSYLMSF